MKFEHEMQMGARRRTMRPGAGRGRGRFRQFAGGRTAPVDRQGIRAWLAGRLPPEWTVDVQQVGIDDEEILVVVALPAVEVPGDDDPGARATAEAARIGGFREETRDRRIQIAAEAEAAWGRVLSWGAACGGTTRTFTSASVPVMTRLRIDERLVLDTLVDAGVARSRSEALAWCVRLVGRNEERWIADLRAAFEHVETVRARGPQAGTGAEPEPGTGTEPEPDAGPGAGR